MITELCEIMKEEGSDKSDLKNNHHNYTLEYYDRFHSIKNTVLNVFEVGLGTNYTDVKSSMGENGIPGASLRGWKRFFPNANVYGADVDKRILFSEDRIKTFFVDQTNTNSIKNLWEDENLKDIKFDIMIDDGLHELYANINFLENSFMKLKENGIYIIEDIMVNEINKYEIKLNELQNNLNFKYEIKILPHRNTADNCLIFIERNDKK